VGAADLEPESPMPRCGLAADCRQPSPCGRAWLVHSHAAGPARPSRACWQPRLLHPAAVPPKISRCWGGGMPSFSSTLSLMREIVSSLSMSISISLPVSVFTLICHRAEATSAYRASPKLGSAARHARSWLEKGGWTVCAVLSQRPAQARRTLQAAGSFSDSGHQVRPGSCLGEQRRARARVADGKRVPTVAAAAGASAAGPRPVRAPGGGCRTRLIVARGRRVRAARKAAGGKKARARRVPVLRLPAERCGRACGV